MNADPTSPHPMKLPRLATRKRLGTYTLPDCAAVARQLAAGETLKAAWLTYAETVPTPIGYTAFSNRMNKWHAKVPQKEIAPGIPDYTPREDAAAEQYWADQADPRSTVHVVTGYGGSLKVEHGQLASFDAGKARRFEPASHRLAAVVFTGKGMVTTEAIVWCAAKGVAVMVLDWHGGLVSVTTDIAPNSVVRKRDAVSLRRAQYTADPLPIARAVLRQKIIACGRSGRVSEFTREVAMARIEEATTLDMLLQVEGRVAFEYWERCSFTLRHKPLGWPVSWREFNGRLSLLTASPRDATHPVNAMLNYAYSVAVGLCVRTLASLGLDPACGFLHADKPGRFSLAYDMLELLRADIDAALLSWIAGHIWRRADFPVTRTSVVRLQPTLARVVAKRTAATLGGTRLMKAAEWLVTTLLQEPHTAATPAAAARAAATALRM